MTDDWTAFPRNLFEFVFTIDGSLSLSFLDFRNWYRGKKLGDVYIIFLEETRRAVFNFPKRLLHE